MVKVKSVFLVIVLSLGIMFGTFTAFATESNIPDATSQFYVNDFANVIDDETEQEMVERARAFSDATDGVQIVVTTVQTIEDADPVRYTVDMYNKYGIGKNNMGVLIMLSVETRDIQMREGDNIRKYISASKCGNIIDDYGIPYLAVDNFEEGLDRMQKATIEYLEGKVNSAENEDVVPIISDTENDEINLRTIGMFLLVLVIIGCLAGAGYGIVEYAKARKEKKKAEEIERIQNSEIVKGKDKKIKSLEDELTNEKERLNGIISLGERKIEFLKNQVSSLQEDYEQLQKRYIRAQMAYPDVDKKIDAIFAKEKENADKAAASRVEIYIENILKHEVTRTNLNKFNDALNKFKSLTIEQKKYVPSKLVSELESAYKESLKLQKEYEEAERIKADKQKATKVQNLILAALAMHVTRHSLHDLSDVCNAYNNLSNDQKKYVKADIETLKNMRRKAERMQEEYEEEERLRRMREEAHRRRQREEEERRRRASSYSSGSSFGGSSGFGGHSSGHGAGRKF